MEEFGCEKCGKKFESGDALKHHAGAKHGQDGGKDNQKYIFVGAVLLIAAVAFLVFSSMASPSRYDNFAKCLSEKGAAMYGTEECKYCKQQKGLFGKSFEYVTYKNCGSVDSAECDAAGIVSYPQWIINGTRYVGAQQLESLASYAGCPL